MKRKVLLVAVLAISMIAFASCGGGNSEVKAKLSGNTWYYNGGSNTVLNVITFTEENATISQLMFDGNGAHEESAGDFEYSVDDSNVVVKMADGSETSIPYTLEGEDFKLGGGDYFTLEEVDAGIQGIWSTGKYSSTVIGRSLASLHEIQFSDGMVSSQNATSSEENGTYYSVHDPTSYSLGNGTLETDMMQGNSWFFNIIDGTPTILHYDKVCQPVDSFTDVTKFSY